MDYTSAINNQQLTREKTATIMTVPCGKVN